MKINVDTIKMRECGKDIIKITNTLNELYNGLFSRISNMPTNTGEWVGESADKFVTLANIDKVQYLNYNNEIAKMGKLLVDYSYKFENDCNNVRRQI